jgi:RHS repeat-associated protein
LSETRDGGASDTYVYESNAAATGNLARLDQVQLGVGGIRDYTFGSAGHLEQVAAGANVVNFSSDDEGRLAGLERLGNTALMRYDGRSFLERVDEGGTTNFVQPAYSSDGMLYSLFGIQYGGATSSRHAFYFAGRPVGILEVPSGGSEMCTFLSTDHLSTPLLATDFDGAEVWSGGFEPFGRDWHDGASNDAQETAIFLRFPGQWFEESWANASSGVDLVYNLHRWYAMSIGRYTRPDPAWQPRRLGELSQHLYASSNPLRFLDPLGLERVRACCNDWDRRHLREIFNQVVDLQSYVIGAGEDPGPLETSPYGDTPCEGYTDYSGGRPTTNYYSFSPGDCVNLCVRFHEQWHRDQCRRRTWPEVLQSNDQLDEGVGYAREASCLTDAISQGFVEVDVDPLGLDNIVWSRQ